MRHSPRAPSGHRARALQPWIRAVLAAGVLAVAAGGSALVPGVVAVAHADEEAPLQVGTMLVARSDCELSKVVIARGAKLQITAYAATTVDVALQDGYVLKRVPKSRIRYFFDVVR